MDTFKNKTILVTGGAGFVGSHLVRRLCREGARVHLLLRQGGDRSRLADVVNDITVHDTDMTDAVAVERVVATVAPSGVFHLAAVSQSFGSVPTIDDLVDVNIRASLHLMDVMQKHEYDFFVNTSSFVEVGKQSIALREDMKVEPTEIYGISRLPALFYGQALGRIGKPIVTVRVFTPYGPWLQKRKLLYQIITQALSDAPISLTSKAVNRDFIYVDDLVDLYLEVARGASKYPGAIFNGGSGTATTLEEVTALILRLTGSHSIVMWQDTTVSYDAGYWQADTTNVCEMLKWQRAHSLEEGITDTIEWFKSHEAYWRVA